MSTQWRVVFFAACLMFSIACQAQPGPVLVVPPSESVAGRAQADWSRAWWQWAGSFSREESPIADRTGALCEAKQQGDVWFLAGTYGTRRTIRECTVPAGKFLFFPLINYMVMARDSRSVTCEAVTSDAARMTNGASALILEIDGVPVEHLQSQRMATTRCFSMGDTSDGRTPNFPAAANGYYVMLRPLSRGTHTLNFGGALPSMLQAVTYTLDVR